MLKMFVCMVLGAALLLVSAVWAGTVIETKLVRLETISGPDLGAVRLVP
jgi:hypothetical protein